MKTVFTQNDDMAWRVVDDECIIVDPQGSQATVLNSMGATIWQLVDGKRDVASIVDSVVNDHEVERATAEADTQEFINELLAKKLIAAS